VRTGVALIVAAIAISVAAPIIAPHATDDAFPHLLNAPPTLPRVVGIDGRLHKPFIRRWSLVSQLEQRFEEDRSSSVPLIWLSGGRLVQSSDEVHAPLMLLGTDSFGRDVFARLLFGAQISIALSLAAIVGAALLGVSVGAVAGYAGGAVDDALMRASDFVIVLPTIYVVLALRSALPLVLSARAVFALLAAIFAVVGAPFFARGVRAIVRSERRLEYAVAAASLGASPARVILRHLVPAARGFVLIEAVLLVPAFIVGEATLSYVGLGFPDPVASWGTMLHDGSSIRAFTDFPWQLSPAVAIFLLVLGLNLALPRSDASAVAYNPDR
jgi:peptide/nickel transport system permease protein